MASIDFTQKLVSLDGTDVDLVLRVDNLGNVLEHKTPVTLAWAVEQALRFAAKDYDTHLRNHNLAKRVMRAEKMKAPLELTSDQITAIKQQAYERWKGTELFGLICDAVDPQPEA